MGATPIREQSEDQSVRCSCANAELACRLQTHASVGIHQATRPPLPSSERRKPDRMGATPIREQGVHGSVGTGALSEPGPSLSTGHVRRPGLVCRLRGFLTRNLAYARAGAGLFGWVRPPSESSLREQSVGAVCVLAFRAAQLSRCDHCVPRCQCRVSQLRDSCGAVW
jgi:hypothetical protein